MTWHNAVLGGGVRARALRAAERHVARSAQLTLGASDDLVARARAWGGRDVRLGPVGVLVLPEPSASAAQVRKELGGARGPWCSPWGRLHPQKGY